MKIKYLVGTLFLFLISTAIFAQRNNIVQKGNQEFENKNYVKAIEHFRKVENNLKDQQERKEITLKIAEGYWLMNQYQQASEYFSKYLNLTGGKDLDIKYKYANSLLKMGNIDEAKLVFSDLLKAAPENKEYKRMVESCEFARMQLAKENIHPIKNQELLNSEQSEFGLAWLDEQLIFASKRLVRNYSTIHGRTNQGFSEIYSSSFDNVNGIYSNPTILKGSINSPFNDGTFSYNPGTGIAYFAQCKKKPEKCEIYTSTFEKNKWTNVKLLALDQSEYNFAHPSINAAGNMLYFASDLPGSIGGKDIWRVSISGSTITGSPENLGESINTDKDDMFPLILGDSILLFSSEGHIGMGGLDVFYSKIIEGIFDEPVNVGVPINSTSDDFSILLNENLNGGYFCSNRNNLEQSDDIFGFYHNIFQTDIHGKVIDSLTLAILPRVKVTYSTDDVPKTINYTDDTGKFNVPFSAHAKCNHVHKLKLEKEGYVTKTVIAPCSVDDEMLIKMWDGKDIKNVVTGKVTNKLTGAPIQNAKVTLNSVKGVNDTVYTDPNGVYYSKMIPPNDYFVLRASRKGFLTDSRTIVVPDNSDAIEISEATGFHTDFQLIPIILENEFRIENIYYEYDKDRLLPKSKVELDKLVNILNENPEITIRINSHADTRGTHAYNQDLSERRGASVVRYLEQNGISKGRVDSKGFGETKLLIPNAKTEEEHQFNRRTTFEIIGTTYNYSVVNESVEVESIVSNKDNTSSTSNAIPALVRKANASETVSDRAVKIASPKNKTDYSDEEIASSNEPDRKIFEELRSTVEPVKKVVPPTVVEEKVEEERTTVNTTNYYIQLLAISNPVNVNVYFKNITDIIKKNGLKTLEVNGLTKYQLGPFSTREEALITRTIVMEKGFPDSFIVNR